MEFTLSVLRIECFLTTISGNPKQGKELFGVISLITWYVAYVPSSGSPLQSASMTCLTHTAQLS